MTLGLHLWFDLSVDLIAVVLAGANGSIQFLNVIANCMTHDLLGIALLLSIELALAQSTLLLATFKIT